MSNINLRKCPFCGADVAVVTTVKELQDCKHFEDGMCPRFEYNDYESEGWEWDCSMFSVVCDYTNGGCGASTGWKKTVQEAVEDWNKRTDGGGKDANDKTD